MRDFQRYSEDLRPREEDDDRPNTELQQRALDGVEHYEQALLARSIAGFGRLQRMSESDERSGAAGVAAVRSEGAGGRNWWPFASLWPLLAYSPVTQQSMWYRDGLEVAGDDEVWRFCSSSGVFGTGRCCGSGDIVDVGPEDGDAKDVRSVSGAVDYVVGCSVEDVGFSELGLWLWFVILFAASFLLIVCYSVVRVKFGHARRIDALRSFSISEFKKRSPKRLQLVTRSESDVLNLNEKLSFDFVVKRLRWRDCNIVWEEFMSDGRGMAGSKCAPRPVVFVVENLRRETEDWRSKKLALELADRMGGAVIICSDVVPAYHMAPGTLDDRDGMWPVWGDEWRELLSSFELQLLCWDEEVNGERYEKDPAVKEILAEGRANADLRYVVCGVAEWLARELPDDSEFSCLNVFKRWRRAKTVSELKERALRNFRAAAQSRFKALWAVSSFDERAQLYALAHGGSPNMRRPAAISSLVSRGLVTAEDPIQLSSEAFGRFIVEDLDDSLDDWRRKGHGDWWRVTWLPLVLLAGLGLLFFINSNPEAVGVIAAIGAAFIGLVPVVTSLFRVGQFGQPTVSSGDE